jgi:acetyltransferase-like isoleucine patch superfamily enzyme
MTGRDQFRIVRPLLTGLSAFLRLFPRPLFNATWFAVRSFPGKPGVGLRYLYAKRLAKRCADNVRLGPGCTILYWENLELGTNVNIHVGTYIDALGGVQIRDDVSIAHSSSVLSFEHTWADESQPIKYNPLAKQPVVIGPDAWIGCGVRVLAGAQIGARTVVAAGAVVTAGEYERGVYAGVPAKLKKSI